ncbi:hypothetical protein [Actinoplanes sp. DH11]|uniref:hypothetical protein n=1 Tax=Actinoplanes sp. DH11 TaxID=2857011 RepID=UPI001E3057E0|nr:hypothetical protein [Actinoplanes sp. DH11]
MELKPRVHPQQRRLDPIAILLAISRAQHRAVGLLDRAIQDQQADEHALTHSTALLNVCRQRERLDRGALKVHGRAMSEHAPAADVQAEIDAEMAGSARLSRCERESDRSGVQPAPATATS